MLKKIRIAVLLLILFAVATDTWLTRSFSTDWQERLYITVYPINADGSPATKRYIERLKPAAFDAIEAFMAREASRYGRSLEEPVRVELGLPIAEQPPPLGESPKLLEIMWWSLKMRWWSANVVSDQERIPPDVRLFVRYHSADTPLPLENSVGMQKGMYGIVNAYASRRLEGRNNVVVAHEFLHTLGASDKYQADTGLPLAPHGLAEPERQPLYPQTHAEIMGGRIALSAQEAEIPKSLRYAVIGPQTATEIRLLR